MESKWSIFSDTSFLGLITFRIDILICSKGSLPIQNLAVSKYVALFFSLICLASVAFKYITSRIIVLHQVNPVDVYYPMILGHHVACSDLEVYMFFELYFALPFLFLLMPGLVLLYLFKVFLLNFIHQSLLFWIFCTCKLWITNFRIIEVGWRR